MIAQPAPRHRWLWALLVIPALCLLGVFVPNEHLPTQGASASSGSPYLENDDEVRAYVKAALPVFIGNEGILVDQVEPGPRLGYGEVGSWHVHGRITLPDGRVRLYWVDLGPDTSTPYFKGYAFTGFDAKSPEQFEKERAWARKGGNPLQMP